MRRHLLSMHPQLADKPLRYFQGLHDKIKSQRESLKKHVTDDISLLRTSFRIALQIAKCKKPINIGEELVKLCVLIACEEMMDSNSVKKIKQIPFSRNTI